MLAYCASLEGCLEYIEALIGRKMLDKNSSDTGAGKENAITFYTSTGMDFVDKTSAYGIMVQFGELSRARTFLNSLQTQTTEQSNFVAVQNINLDYLANPAAYILTNSNKNLLYSIGTTAGSLNGYGRALYEVLTGERIETEIPLAWRSSPDKYNSEKITLVKAYPNPLSGDFFNISIENLGEGLICDIVLSDAYGRIHSIKTIQDDGVYQVNESPLQNGIYFISITDNLDKQIYQSKLVVLK